MLLKFELIMYYNSQICSVIYDFYHGAITTNIDRGYRFRRFWRYD